MTESQDVLVPSLRGNSSVEPPYSNAQISETVTHREILRIYRLARPETKVVYDLGRDTDRVEEENWVIRWMLWHVFRYRDSRNRNRRHISPSPDRGQPTNPSISSIAGSSSSHHCEYKMHRFVMYRPTDSTSQTHLQARAAVTDRAIIGILSATNGA